MNVELEAKQHRTVLGSLSREVQSTNIGTFNGFNLLMSSVSVHNVQFTVYTPWSASIGSSCKEVDTMALGSIVQEYLVGTLAREKST